MSNRQESGNLDLSANDRSRAMDLGDLIDIALQNNPDTRRAWQQARAAAAQYASTEAPYYPQFAFDSTNGYQRTMLELPATSGQLKQWQAQPALDMTYVLLDFGRRRSSLDAARERAIASNFGFNRVIQDVVFSTQSAFYSLDASHEAVIAAQRNLDLAQSDYDAVSQRVSVGLATEPQLLLAKEQVAQSRFDLANARLSVHDAESQIAIALGISPDKLPVVEGLGNLRIPESLNGSVETIMMEARRQRPDLAAQMANLNETEAEVRNARSQFYPSLQLSSGYGENAWSFNFYRPEEVRTAQPQYSAMVDLHWDIFTGFRRLNDVRAAERNRDVARAELGSVEINVLAQVWRAYYEYQSSLSKYAYAQSLIAASTDSYDANIMTYRQGLSTIVELLTAERDLANARYTLIQSKAELLTAYAAVAYAAGQSKLP